MSRRITFISMFFCLFVECVPIAFAAGDVTVVGTVGGTTSPTGTTIVFSNTATHKDVVTQAVNPMGKYMVSLPQGTYDITIKPPTGSNIQTITKKAIAIQSNSVENIAVPAAVNPLPTTTNTQNTANNEEMYGLAGAMAALIAVGIGFMVWKRR